MPPLNLLNRPKWSRGRVLGMWALRGYLVIAVVLLLAPPSSWASATARAETHRVVARSAGLLVYRRSPEGAVEVLIAHPGGPYWARKDDGAWSVPKGEYGDGDDPLDAAYGSSARRRDSSHPKPSP